MAVFSSTLVVGCNNDQACVIYFYCLRACCISVHATLPPPASATWRIEKMEGGTTNAVIPAGRSGPGLD